MVPGRPIDGIREFARWGSILVGVREESGKFIPDGLTSSQADSFDQSIIGDFARNHCSELPDFSVHRVELDGDLLVLIEIREFKEEPILCTRDVQDADNNPILRNGAMYIRTDDAKCEEPKSSKEMRRVIRLAVRKQGDDLIGQIRDLVGSTVSAGEAPSDGPFAEEISKAEEFFESRSVPDSESIWQFSISPTNHEVERWTRAELREARQDTQVALRGWYVPHIDNEHDNNFDLGVQSWTNWDRYFEAHRLYRSGLAIWRRRFWEDSIYDKETLSYVSAIWSVTEQVLFMSRFAETLYKEGDVIVNWRMSQLEGRHLRTDPGSGVFLSLDYMTEAEQLRRSLTTSVADLRGGWRDIATDWTQELMELFQFSVGRDVVHDWQSKLLEKRF